MTERRFDNRVAIVTGAGGGLGRQYALTLAERGCQVVVNDLGGSAHGEGNSSSAADKVVQEIRDAGGTAVANHDSVENGQSIVQTALDTYGTVDIVINNAGILRDVSFAKMTQDDWDRVLSVHLEGSMSVTHAAWPIMREKEYGRIIMTTSAAGLYGNFGQANYCAAKLGLAGLANCLAEEGRSKNIHVNTIAPIAASRLTETVMPANLLENLKPEAVSPLVAWLCHENCEETKGIFEVGAGHISKLRWERTQGNNFPLGKAFSIDDVARRWEKITDFTDAYHPSNINDSFSPILDNINNPSLGGNEFIDLDAASKESIELTSSYDENDLSLYALSVGAARDPLDKEELKFVYELGSNFQALPTYGVMPQIGAMLKAAKEGTLTLPGMNFGFDRLLHGEQFTEIKRPLPPHAKLKHTFRFKNALDKDPNAVVTFAITSTDENDNEVAYNEMTSFVKGAGGWGGDRGGSGEINMPPDRAPDAVIEEKTDANQTLLYRLCGDWNPLHADPAFAKAFGYDQPILHGLCTYGYAGRHVIKAFSNNDGRYFKNIKVRFAKTVFPGETLETRMWKESDNRIVFETRAKERNEVVLKNAAIELFSEIPAEAPAPEPVAAEEGTASPVEEAVTPDDVFAAVANYIAQKPELVEQTGTRFQFEFSNPDKSYFIDLKNAPGAAGPGTLDKPDVTLALDSKHLSTVFGGDLAAVQKLFFGGELKISGNVMASNKLTVLQDMDPQLVEQERDKRVAAGGGSAAQASASAESQEPIMADVFNAIDGFIADNPDLVEKTGTSFQFSFSNPDQDFFIDLNKAPGSAGPGQLDKADVTLALDAKHAPTLFGGDLAAVQKLFFGGDLKISGNVMASNKLTVLENMEPERVEQARDKRLASGQPEPAAASSRKKKEPQAEKWLPALADKLTALGGQGGIVQFKVQNPDSDWFIDLSASSPTVSSGVKDATAVVTLDDDKLADLVSGDVAMRVLFQHGDMYIDGDVSLVRKLENLVSQPNSEKK